MSELILPKTIRMEAVRVDAEIAALPAHSNINVEAILGEGIARGMRFNLPPGCAIHETFFETHEAESNHDHVSDTMIPPVRR